MSYLLDTNVVSELVRPRPSRSVVGWFDSVPSTALHHGVRLVTRNARDFQFPGLGLVDPWEGT